MKVLTTVFAILVLLVAPIAVPCFIGSQSKLAGGAKATSATNGIVVMGGLIGGSVLWLCVLGIGAQKRAAGRRLSAQMPEPVKLPLVSNIHSAQPPDARLIA